MSIRTKLFLYFALFTALIVLSLILVQVVFLDDIYKAVKNREIKIYADTVEKNINSGKLDSVCEAMSKKYNICMILCDSSGNIVISKEAFHYCFVHRTDETDRYILSSLAYSSENGEYKEVNANNYLSRDPFMSDRDYDDVAQSLLFVKCLYKSSSQNPYFLMLNSSINPISETADTLMTEIWIISIAFIAIAFLFALFISNRITKPISSLEKSASRLADGKYDAVFDAVGYKEIENLSAALNFAESEMGKAERLKRELLANISHDLRTPLTMISGYSEMMRDIPGENTKENADIIASETKRLTALVNDVIDLSKLEADRMPPSKEEYNICSDIENIVLRYSKFKEAEGFFISFEKECDANVYADRKQLEQVIYNLLNNAINYSGENKTIKIVQRLFQNGDMSYVKIDIIDYGIGIAKENLSTIWDRYYREDREHKRPTLGSGIGLSIVKNILSQHGASYGVSSEIGKGSDFWFILPCRKI